MRIPPARGWSYRFLMLPVVAGGIAGVLFGFFGAKAEGDPPDGVVVETTASNGVLPTSGFCFEAGVHTLTGDALIQAREDLKAALEISDASDPNEMLVFAGHLDAGTRLHWWVAGEQVVVSGVLERNEVVQAQEDAGDHLTMSVLDVDVQDHDGTHATQAYLLVVYNDTEELGASFPIPAESWHAFHFDLQTPYPGIGTDGTTCAEDAVDWCTDWYPPCTDPDPGSHGGIVGCFARAACRAANCHHLACITNAYDCCEEGHDETYCEWRDYLTAGRNLEHVTCDTVHVLEKGMCLPWGAIKGLLD